ncbi:MAG: hypothetical protein ACLGGX_02030 [Bdellovibrionia bacterium]
MGITDRMNMMVENAKQGTKNTAFNLLHWAVRLITGFFLGFTLALIFQQVMGFGVFALIFFTVVVMGVVLKVLSSWSLPKILIFDLFCILVGMLLRMYILVAP